MFEYLHGTTPNGLGCMALASVGALLFGFDNGWWGTILGAERFLRDYGSCRMVDGKEVCNLSTSQLSAGSAVQSVGIMLGCLIAAYLNKILGRRYALVTTGIVSIIGVVIELTSAAGSSPRFDQFVVGKTIAALSMGLAANIVPIYLSETSTGAARGFAINMYQNIMVLGFIAAAGTVYGSSSLDNPGCYLIPMGLQLLAPTVLVICCPFMPESPRWLVIKGRHDEAVISAGKLFNTKTNDFNAQDYVNKLEISIQVDEANRSSWLDLLHGSDLRRLLIAMGVQSLQQAQGSTYANNYIVPFLNDNGITNVFPVIMGIHTVYYVSILTGHFLPDRFGRRPLLMSTALFCGICLTTISSLVVAYQPSTETSRQGAIAMIIIWQVGFGIHSPLVWITTAECAPTRNRERLLAVAVFFGFGVSLLIASVSPYLQNEGYGNLGGRMGFIFGAFSFITVLWVYFFVPEMKGFSLEQLDHMYQNKVPARKFKGYQFADAVLAEKADSDQSEPKADKVA